MLLAHFFRSGASLRVQPMWRQCRHWCSVALLSISLDACQLSGPTSHQPAAILLFNGEGTSRHDVAALETLLREHRLAYSKVNSEQLNDMSEAHLAAARLMIVPGGNYETMGRSLNPNSARKIHDAVKNNLNYLGICAGAFLAGAVADNGFDLTSGVRFHFYSAESQGIRKAALAIRDVRGGTLDQYWEDGPELSGFGDVVARYPDGMPAVVEGHFGNGWLVLSGVHPEAPPSWRDGMSFQTPIGVDQAYATRLIDAALNRTSLAHD